MWRRLTLYLLKEIYMYAEPNFKSKKALKEAVKNGEIVTAFQPGGLFPGQTDGWVTLEGPHYPQPHRWYATALLKDKRVVQVK